MAGGYPICVLTPGSRHAGAEAIAAQTGAKHIIVPGTDHGAQKAGQPVNDLLDERWSLARSGDRT